MNPSQMLPNYHVSGSVSVPAKKRFVACGKTYSIVHYESRSKPKGVSYLTEKCVRCRTENTIKCAFRHGRSCNEIQRETRNDMRTWCLTLVKKRRMSTGERKRLLSWVRHYYRFVLPAKARKGKARASPASQHDDHIDSASPSDASWNEESTNVVTDINTETQEEQPTSPSTFRLLQELHVVSATVSAGANAALLDGPGVDFTKPSMQSLENDMEKMARIMHAIQARSRNNRISSTDSDMSSEASRDTQEDEGHHRPDNITGPSVERDAEPGPSTQTPAPPAPQQQRKPANLETVDLIGDDKSSASAEAPPEQQQQQQQQQQAASPSPPPSSAANPPPPSPPKEPELTNPWLPNGHINWNKASDSFHPFLCEEADNFADLLDVTKDPGPAGETWERVVNGQADLRDHRQAFGGSGEGKGVGFTGWVEYRMKTNAGLQKWTERMLGKVHALLDACVEGDAALAKKKKDDDCKWLMCRWLEQYYPEYPLRPEHYLDG